MIPLLALAPADAPVEVPAEWYFGTWIVTAEVGGRTGRFAVATQAREVVRQGFSDGGTLDVRLGDAALGATEFAAVPDAVLADAKVDGVLGWAALGGRPVGFARRPEPLVRLWPKGRGDLAAAWVDGDRLSTGIVALSVTLRPGAAEGGVPFGSPKDPTERAYEVPSVPGRALPFLLASEEERVSREGVDGLIPVDLGYRGRVVLDLANGALVGRPETTDEAISRELSDFANFEVEVRGDALVVAAAPADRKDPTTERARPFTGNRVYKVEDYDLSLIVQALRTSAGRRDVLEALGALNSGPYRVYVVTKPGGRELFVFTIRP